MNNIEKDPNRPLIVNVGNNLAGSSTPEPTTTTTMASSGSSVSTKPTVPFLLPCCTLICSGDDEVVMDETSETNCCGSPISCCRWCQTFSLCSLLESKLISDYLWWSTCSQLEYTEDNILDSNRAGMMDAEYITYKKAAQSKMNSISPTTASS